MIVDGKRLTAGERIRLLIGLEKDAAPRQQELPLDDDEMRYRWQDFRQSDGDEDEAHRAMAGIIVAVVCSVPLFVLLLWWLIS